ncbi:hypothetical protein CTI12_AA453290 [Artemisia annua]|uniref:Uncharacterized protein n=1 Tax=Artemisia annua TaxID=35608 RepID=A0A2U1LU44_ARTAN|nr:hypothetical protein CTI12_AA453290 [Artemisia annua]
MGYDNNGIEVPGYGIDVVGDRVFKCLVECRASVQLLPDDFIRDLVGNRIWIREASMFAHGHVIVLMWMKLMFFYTELNSAICGYRRLLHTRIMDTVESPKFLNQLKTLHKDSVDGIPGLDLRVDEILINVGREEPSLWIWVSDEMLHENVEEKSGIDNDNYVVISQEQVVDAIGNFMARCALLNPKAMNMSPEEMQKRLTKAFRSMSKFEKLMELWHAGQLFYLMATWGLTLAGLYQSRALLRVAARGVHSTGKVVMKAF